MAGLGYWAQIFAATKFEEPFLRTMKFTKCIRAGFEAKVEPTLKSWNSSNMENRENLNAFPDHALDIFLRYRPSSMSLQHATVSQNQMRSYPRPRMEKFKKWLIWGHSSIKAKMCHWLPRIGSLVMLSWKSLIGFIKTISAFEVALFLP